MEYFLLFVGAVGLVISSIAFLVLSMTMQFWLLLPLIGGVLVFLGTGAWVISRYER